MGVYLGFSNPKVIIGLEKPVSLEHARQIILLGKLERQIFFLYHWMSTR